ncbi:MAG: hypothetical protein ACYC46_09785 [Acidobacteriaceae bacterium]
MSLKENAAVHAATDTDPQAEYKAVSAVQSIHVTADAALVGRTQRIVRERALAMQAQRNRWRHLWLACGVSSALLVMIASAIWSVLTQYNLTPTDVPDSSMQMMVLGMWFLPVSAAILLLVLFKRSRSRTENETLQREYRAGHRVQIIR